jgi:hypothetical protein
MSQRVIRHADAAAPPKPTTLPAKEAALFKQIIKCYELKQYKKAVKAADAVLKKVAEHGETLAMKALVLSQMPAYAHDKEKKDEVMTMAKLGLKNDLKSTVCGFRGEIGRLELWNLAARDASSERASLRPQIYPVDRCCPSFRCLQRT